MGKDYLNTYKKNYEGDYTKAYQDEKRVKEMRSERKKNYDFVSKKIGTTSYNKSEKANIYQNIQAGVVSATGPETNKERSSNPSSLVEKQPKIEKRQTTRLTTPLSIEKEKKHVEPKKIATPSQKASRKAKIGEGKFDYINKGSLEPPIRRVANSAKYQDIYTEQYIDVAEAIERLEYVGYAKKTPLQDGIFILITAISVLVPLLGPIALIKFGQSMLKNEIVDYERIVGERKLIFSITASTKDKEEYKRRGNMCKMLGILYLFLQYRLYW